jgi:hypothetical protein
MNAAATQSLQVQVPHILKSHGRQRKGMSAGPGKKSIEVILWLVCTVTTAPLGVGHGKSWQGPLTGGEIDAFLPAFKGWNCLGLTCGTAGGATAKGHELAIFLNDEVAMKGTERMLTGWWSKVVSTDSALALQLNEFNHLGKC